MRKIWIILAVTLLTAAALMGTAAAEPKQEEYADVVLYGVYRPNPSTGWVAAGCVDRAGKVWLAERADVPWPCTDEAIREMLRTRRGMKMYQSLVGDRVDGTLMNEAWFSRELPAMVASIPAQEGRPRKTGVDVGQEAVYALRKNRNGEEESVLLGMSGSYVYENTSPEAQRLYLFMWRLLTLDEIFNAKGIGLAAEGIAPQGFRSVPLREFFHMKEGDLSSAIITAIANECEEGPRPMELSTAETEKIRAMAQRGMIIRKENCLAVTGGTVSYQFRDAQGNSLGGFETWTTRMMNGEEDSGYTLVTLAVAADGMYQIALAPEPTDNLTEEDLRMLTVQIEGVDYVVGKNTPRDLIHNGWNCFPEWDGTFSFQDPEMNNSILVNTAGDSLDEPIQHISCQLAGDADIAYHGFDGRIDEDGQERDWTGLTEWVEEVIGAGQDVSEPGTSVIYTLSDGRELYLYSESSPIVLYLSGRPEDPMFLEYVDY